MIHQYNIVPIEKFLVVESHNYQIFSDWIKTCRLNHVKLIDGGDFNAAANLALSIKEKDKTVAVLLDSDNYHYFYSLSTVEKDNCKIFTAVPPVNAIMEQHKNAYSTWLFTTLHTFLNNHEKK